MGRGENPELRWTALLLYGPRWRQAGGLGAARALCPCEMVRLLVNEEVTSGHRGVGGDPAEAEAQECLVQQRNVPQQHLEAGWGECGGHRWIQAIPRVGLCWSELQGAGFPCGMKLFFSRL